MAKCKNCRNLTSVEEYGEKYPWCDMLDDCPNIEFERDCPKFEKMSNADAIRNMTDEELAEFLVDHHNYPCKYCVHCWKDSENDVGCKGALMRWLKSEVKE